jgi:histidinol-phosphate aminotransferase
VGVRARGTNLAPVADSTIAELLVPELAELTAYAPVDGDYAVRLDANEAPPFLRLDARARLAEIAAGAAWERYPDARATELRSAIAAHSGVDPDEVLVGAGSDELITMLITALARPRAAGQPPTLLTTTPTFVMYKLSARVRGWRVIEVPLDRDWDLATDQLLRANEISPPSLIFIASPNNPTSRLCSRDRLEAVIHAANGALVVIDEAYVDYAARDHFDLYRAHENVALLRTLSKVGFAALRVGWMIARPALIAEIDKTRLPYNLPSLSQRLGALVLGELDSERRHVIDQVKLERAALAAKLRDLPRIALTPSDSNFFWVRTERPAGEVFANLCERGILVRSFHERGGRLAHQIRITVGTPDENSALLRALGEVT